MSTRGRATRPRVLLIRKSNCVSDGRQTLTLRRRYVVLQRAGLNFAKQDRILMTRITRRSWTRDQIDLLLALVEKGVSPVRASVVLRRPKLAVQNKARQLGKPFADVREVKAARLAREASELKMIERHEAQSRASGALSGSSARH
jgi:hypothetical protein